jgi:hypothetical protein
MRTATAAVSFWRQLRTGAKGALRQARTADLLLARTGVDVGAEDVKVADVTLLDESQRV